MNRKRIGLAAVTVTVLIIAALFAQKKQPKTLLVLDWAAKSSLERPPSAVLIEFGHKDEAPTDWAGEATVTGAKIVHREGYRFRPKAGDELTATGWKASSRHGIRMPVRNANAARIEGIATIGVVLHLTDIADDAALTIQTTGAEKSKSIINIKDVVSGKPQALLDGRGVVRLVSTATPVATGKTEDDFPAACYGPDGTLWVAWVGYHLKDETRRVESTNLKQQPADFRSYYTPEFGDQVFAKYYKDGKWSQPIAVTGASEDIVRCAIAADGDGRVWVFYSALRGGNRAMCAKALKWTGNGDEHKVQTGDEQLLPKNDERNANAINPEVATISNGELRFVSHFCSAVRGHHATDVLSLQNGQWRRGWTQGTSTTGGWGGRGWQSPIAAGPSGNWSNLYEGYSEGSYSISGTIVTQDGERVTSISRPLLYSSRFEARPSIVYDPAGRLWIAYEEGPELWGKDYGALDYGDGNPLYSSRSVRVVCLADGKLMKPVAELPTSNVPLPKTPYANNQNLIYERAARYSGPQIGIDGKGRVWLTYRQKFGTRNSSQLGSYWLTFARRLDGDTWSEPIEIHHSCGLLDHRPVLLPHKSGGLLVVHNTDGRYTTPQQIDNDIYLSYIDLPGEPREPKLVAHDPGKKDPKLVARHERETQAVKRIRDYRVENNGKSYQLLRGEFHRHTEISWDGGPDGSLEDMFRYAIDAANFDWIGNGDHDNGAGREYSWWLTQKFTDAYTVPGRFTGMFTYERSVPYPHGHRNCVFARRGIRTLPRLADPMSKEPPNIHADDTKMLYRYLKELGGVCAVHTSATSMGTDWRDNDPQVEPFVEIYQGDRMSYEKEQAPRAGYDPSTKREPVNIAGWYPKGFLDNALLNKGYRLGFQASSDHWSTHISYCIVLAEKNDRESILDGMRKRHVYGATDDIICDVRSGAHIMGDEFEVTGTPKLQVKVVGTSDLAMVEVLRDSSVVATLKINGRECSEEWTDPQPKDGVHYYYVRVLQKDGEIAWTSPMWIATRK
jgi:hypothetical protein